jgi:predicted nucleotidyltransferase
MIFTYAIEKRQTEEAKTIRASAKERAIMAANLLKTKYGAKRVLLFGSICRNAYVHKRSDIDLLVEGLDSDDLLHAGFDAWMITRPFDVDIIPIERADKAIVENALREGVEL